MNFSKVFALVREKAHIGIAVGLCAFAFGLCLSVSISQLGLALAFVAWLLIHDARELFPKDKYVRHVIYGWLAYLLSSVLSAFMGIDTARSFSNFHSELARAGTCIFLLAAMKSQKDSGKIMFFYFLGAACAAGWAISKFLHRYFYENFFGRITSTINAVTFGEVMEVAFFLGLIYCLRKKSGRAGYLFFTGISGCALLLSQTRGAIAGFTTALIILFILHKELRLKILAVIALIAGGIIFMSWQSGEVYIKVKSIPVAVRRMVSPYNGKVDVASQLRLEQWDVGLKIIKDYPLFGAGPSNIRNIFNFYHPAKIDGQFWWGNLHNLYIHHTAERGLVGAAALLYLLGAMFALVYKAYRTQKNNYTLWAMPMFIGFLVMNMTETSFRTALTSMTISFMIAVAYSWREDER
ncbi:MAG: O-antigen ligase family protein [Elusimicrobia bacterium]|nr:O-antigen ligase family protein [Elusimicrobiota bacterium]